MSETTPEIPKSERRPPLRWKLIVPQILLLAALAAWVLLVQRPVGWPGEWVIEVYGLIYPARFLLAPALAMIGFGGLIAYLWRSMRREKIESHRRALAWSVAVAMTVGAWMLQVGLWSVAPDSVSLLAAIQLSDVSTGYLSEAMRIDHLPTYLRTYVEEMPRMAEHVATHPPGAVLFFYVVRQLADAVPALSRAALVAGSTAVSTTIPELAADVGRYPTVVWQGHEGLAVAILGSWLLGAAGALVPLVTFAALRRWLGFDRALAAAALLALTPGILLYFATLAQLMILFSAVLLAALVASQRHVTWTAVAGLVAAAALFVSLSALALVALAGIFLLLRASRQVGESADLSWSATPSVFTPLLAFGAGLLVGLGLWYAAGVNAVGVFAQGLGAHAELTGPASFRSYWIWVWMNFVEFAIFLGLPLTVLVVASVPGMIRALQRKAGMMLPAYLGMTAVIALLLLDLSGVVRGETGRLWMLFAPWLAAGVAPTVMDEGGSCWRLVAIVCALTGIQLLLMAWTMQPIMRPF